MITNFDFSVSTIFNWFLKNSIVRPAPWDFINYIANQQSIENDIKGLELGK